MQPWVFVLWGCSQAEPAGEVPPSFAALGLGRETAEEVWGQEGSCQRWRQLEMYQLLHQISALQLASAFPKAAPAASQT